MKKKNPIEEACNLYKATLDTNSQFHEAELDSFKQSLLNMNDSELFRLVETMKKAAQPKVAIKKKGNRLGFIFW
jgi:succinate dehydrogenase flavin-adding protein (antitoxin of CptAB toxin-antitoxin module)